MGPGTRRTGDSGSVRAKVLSVFTDPREDTAGCIRIFADKKSGKDAERGELRKTMDYLRPGDTLIVSSLDRLGRSLQDLIAIVAGLASAASGSAC